MLLTISLAPKSIFKHLYLQHFLETFQDIMPLHLHLSMHSKGAKALFIRLFAIITCNKSNDIYVIEANTKSA